MLPLMEYIHFINTVIVIAIVTVGQWERLLDVIGRPELKDVPEYRSQVDRVNHMDVIDAMVEEWARERTVEEMIGLLRAVDLPCSPVPIRRPLPPRR